MDAPSSITVADTDPADKLDQVRKRLLTSLVHVQNLSKVLDNEAIGKNDILAAIDSLLKGAIEQCQNITAGDVSDQQWNEEHFAAKVMVGRQMQAIRRTLLESTNVEVRDHK